MEARSVVTHALAIAGLAASLAPPCSAQTSGKRGSTASAVRSATPPVPVAIQALARRLHVAPQDLAELAVEGAIPAESVEVLTNAFALAEAVAYGLGVDEGQRNLFAGQIANTLVRIEREAGKPRRASFAELRDQIRRDARETVRANLGDEAAGAAQALLEELAPLKEHR